MRKKIMIIENQYTQYKKLKTHLANKNYSIVPAGVLINNGDNHMGFESFINKYKIFLNPIYGGLEDKTLRKKMFNEITEEIKNTKPNLLIIDIILVGSHLGKNGIFLAKWLRDNGISTPILFLSKLPFNKMEILDELTNALQPYEWVSKGYYGKNILDEDYIDNQVISRIKALISGGIIDYLKVFLDSRVFNRYLNDLRTLIDKIQVNSSTPIDADIIAWFRTNSFNPGAADSDEFNNYFQKLNKLFK